MSVQVDLNLYSDTKRLPAKSAVSVLNVVCKLPAGQRREHRYFNFSKSLW